MQKKDKKRFNTLMKSNSITLSRSTKSVENPEMKCYQADQKVKYLYLQAEIEVLLHQLQNYKPGVSEN